MAAAFLNTERRRPMTTSTRTFTTDNAKAVQALRHRTGHRRPCASTATTPRTASRTRARSRERRPRRHAGGRPTPPSPQSSPLLDTALEPDPRRRAVVADRPGPPQTDRVQRQLDDTRSGQRDSQQQQDGSEIRSVELERLLEQGRAILERRSAFEHMRDRAAEHYEAHTGIAWRPRTGSLVNHKHLTDRWSTAATSSPPSAAPRPRCICRLAPRSPSAAASTATTTSASGPPSTRCWPSTPAWSLLHGGSPRGAEKIAACWAASRKVVDVPFKPDWTREGKAAPFKRNRPHARRGADRAGGVSGFGHHRQPGRTRPSALASRWLIAEAPRKRRLLSGGADQASPD